MNDTVKIVPGNPYKLVIEELNSERIDNGWVHWKHLSIPLKIATVLAYIFGGIYVIYFIVGFITGFAP